MSKQKKKKENLNRLISLLDSYTYNNHLYQQSRHLLMWRESPGCQVEERMELLCNSTRGLEED